MKWFTPKLLTLALTMLLVIALENCKKDNDLPDNDQDIDAPQNQPPIVDAGSSQTITLPNTVTLSGSADDTDGNVVAFLWSQVSGPSASTIADPGSNSTEVSFIQKGTYLFQLMATDNLGATGVDTVSVVVNAPEFDTLSLAPSNNPDEYEIAEYNGGDASNTGTIEIPVEAWTNQGLPLTIREVIKFDLSSIPSNATITKATLSIFSDPHPINGNLVDANYGSNNSMYLQQVTSDWSGSTISWFNQPSVSTDNEISIPTTTNSFLDLNIDVTNMVGSMVNNNANYGFLLSLQNEVTYNSRIFCSSYYSDAAKHPKLMVIYHKN